MATFDDLINRQQEAFQNIKQISINYKKDSETRKTSDYLDKRITALETHWSTFETNHKLILKTEEKDIEYFKDDVFTKTKEMYKITLNDMIRLREERITKTLSTPRLGAASTSAAVTPDVMKPNAEETTNLPLQILQQQQCQFMAFERTVSKISLETMTEKWDLEDQLNSVRRRWDAIDKLHWQIMQKCSDINYEQEYYKHEETFDRMRREINKKIWANVHFEKSTPTIQVPDFNGNYTQWLSFRDLFIEVIHANPLLPKAQKISHLKAKLKGEAERLVHHLAPSGDNYDSCWEILLHRYDNPRLLFTSFANTLLNQPTLQYQNAYALKKLHDVTLESLNGLSNIGLNISTWDPLIVHILLQKLDPSTYNDYIQHLESPRNLPGLDEFLQFLESRFMAMETISSRTQSAKPSQQNYTTKSNVNPRAMNYNRSQKSAQSYHAAIRNCPVCKTTTHVLMQCRKFINMNSDDRYDTVMKYKLCKNCLYSHGDQACTSTKRCFTCNSPHHTLLHQRRSEPQQYRNEQHHKIRSTNHVEGNEGEILLTTALLKTKNYAGDFITLRALLDQGSQASIITEEAMQRLRLPRKKNSTIISGVGISTGNCKGLVSLNCKSLITDYSFTVEALIMKNLIRNLPTSTFEKSWTHIDKLELADPGYNISGPIDILLGADVYCEVLQDGVLKSKLNSPVAQQTKLGWILCGKVKVLNCLVTLNELEDLTRFWESEEITKNECLTGDDYCEKYYTETTTRTAEGRYVVKMPMKDNYENELGTTKPRAMSQFFQLEKKMKRASNLAKMYKQFIDEYTDLGHMKPVRSMTSTPDCSVYLPHHGVLREESTSTKLRVVFNASMKSSTGKSLNDLMEKGPNLQKDLQALLIKWRSYRYILTADVEKCFRQILLNEDQHHLQRILWRAEPTQTSRSSLEKRTADSGKLIEMELCTVTYGTKAAPYLAMRTLKQLALDEGHNYPNGAKKLLNECYMDDVITGSDTVEDAIQLHSELSALLKKGGFHLRKWFSNEPGILEGIPADHRSDKNCLEFRQEENVKTLGLSYNRTLDGFIFNWKLADFKEKITKRILLSEISKMYDPLGWLSPVTIKAKLLFQRVWIDKTEWEQQVTADVETEWRRLYCELPYINDIVLRRWLHCQDEIDLLGFCDSSEKAYSCVVYSRTKLQNGTCEINLIAAKTRVTPLNKKISLPRLELNGALLLTKLIEKIQSSLCEKKLRIACWTDSQVVLAWLRGDVMRWEKYVANRVTQITSTIPSLHWNYVKTDENPADCATRGLLPSQLLTFKLWWNGPSWIKTTEIKENTRPITTLVITSESEANITKQQNADASSLAKRLLVRISSLTRLIRVTSWIVRFTELTRKRKLSVYDSNILTMKEMDNALHYIIKHEQIEAFREDVEDLKKNGMVRNRSKLLNLKPYLDHDGILRVGGRLELSSLPEETKHPIILPHRGRLTQLIIEDCHNKTYHGGARLTLAQTRAKYWILGGNRAVKNITNKCIRCHRQRARANNQIMADLPQERITPSRPFSHTGIDFTGHVELKINKGRGVKTCKGYIAIFICMVTKAVHIELVSDLTTQTFLAAFQRMCSRRGCPKHVFTDNGTNFVGAAKLLYEDFQQHKTITSEEFRDIMNKQQIKWHFNAPLWPTAGGLWEAAVKSMKYHLRRVLGEQKLTFEEFSTLLAQIEGCLNSRPLIPLSEDSQDLDYLTPGHFLTGSPMLSLPREEHKYLKNVDLRERWRLVEHLQQHIWDRWSKEYLHQLQVRSKWHKPTKNMEEGDLVLIKDTNLPPGRWALGRVQESHAGKDGFVRVVTLKTKNGIIKRPITKLSPLPIETNPCSQEESNTRLNSDDETTPTQKLSGKKKETRNFSLNCYFTLLLTILTSIGGVKSTTTSQKYEIRPFGSERPLYFDELGKIQYVHDEWRLLVYYNLTTYWEGTTKVENYIQNFESLCSKDTSRVCVPLLNQLSHEVKQLSVYNSLLLMSQTQRRKKRGYFNGVGNLASTLFGVLDDKFAEKYQEDIENVHNNEDYLLELVKNQTIIVEAENQVLKKNEQFMRSQFAMITNFTQEFTTKLDKIQSTFITVMTLNELNGAALTCDLFISNLKRTQDLLMNTLTNVNRGHLDAHLLTPSQLIDQLNLISAKMPSRLMLPVKNFESNLKELYKILFVKARITKQYLLYEIHIPLTSDEEYTAYRIIPLPITRNGQTVIVKTKSQVLAINFKKNTFITMEGAELQQCTKTGESSYICTEIHPVYNLHNEDAPCEAAIFSQRSTMYCDTLNTKCKNDWIRLHTRNTWLYSCCELCSIRVICDEQLISTKITGAGSIAIGQECMIQQKEATIYSQNYFGSNTNVEPELYLSQLQLSPVNKMANLSFPSLKLDTDNRNSSEGIRQIEEDIHRQKEREKLPQPIHTHDIHQYAVLYSLVALALITAIVYLVKRRRRVTTTETRQAVITTTERPIELAVIDNRTKDGPTRTSSRKIRKYFDFNDTN